MGYRLRLIVALISAGSTISLANSGLAQQQQQRAETKPASTEIMDSMALAAAVGICIMAEKEAVSVSKSSAAMAKGMAYVLNIEHGAQVAGISGRLEPQQLITGSILQIAALVQQGCHERISTEDKKFIDDLARHIDPAPKGEQSSSISQPK